MKLILTQEVDGLGAPGDVVEVKDGYGRNYLVPRGLATRWTRGGRRPSTRSSSARVARAVRDHDHAEEIKAKLEPGAVNVSRSVRARAAASSAPSRSLRSPTPSSAASGESVDKRTIVVTNPIKTLGAHEVSVKLHDEVSAKVALNVIPA